MWKTHEIPLIYCKVILILTWSKDCVITNSIGAGKQLYCPVVTLLTQDNAKSGFKRAIEWNKYQSDPKTYAENRYLNHLVHPSFQGVNRLFVLPFENENDRRSHSNYHLPKVTITDYNIMIDGKNVFDQPVNSKFNTYKNIRKIVTGKEDDYTTGCLW